MVLQAAYVTAILSAVCNGTFAALYKLDCVQRELPKIFVFQLYTAVGVFVTSWVALLFRDVKLIFTWWGMLSGFLFTLSIYTGYKAVDRTGLAVAQGIWGAFAIITSFLWGVGAFPEENTIKSWPMAISALILLITSICGIGQGYAISAKQAATGEEDPTYGSFWEDDYANRESQLKHSLVSEPASIATEVKDETKKFALGVLAAILTGVVGGSILVPMHFVEAKSDFAFLPSFGTGCLFSSIAFTMFESHRIDLPAVDLCEEMIRSIVIACAGIASGAIWNVGNALSIFSIPEIGYSVAYPLLQCAVVVSGFWGVCVFREITGKGVWYFAISCVGVVVGGILLANAIGSEDE